MQTQKVQKNLLLLSDSLISQQGVSILIYLN